MMERIMNYVKPELIVVAVVLYFIGTGLKQSQTVKDKYIPLILGGLGIALCAVWVFASCPISTTCTDCSFGLTISLNIFFGSYVIPFVRIAKITLSILQAITINDCNFFSGLSFRVV